MTIRWNFQHVSIDENSISWSRSFICASVWPSWQAGAAPDGAGPGWTLFWQGTPRNHRKPTPLLLRGHVLVCVCVCKEFHSVCKCSGTLRAINIWNLSSGLLSFVFCGSMKLSVECRYPSVCERERDREKETVRGREADRERDTALLGYLHAAQPQPQPCSAFHLVHVPKSVVVCLCVCAYQT